MSFSQHPLDNRLLLGRYRVMRLLGEGGMGTVHLARVEGAEGFTRPVVVKRMKHDIKATEEGHRLFIREAKILSKLQHPGIVGISDFGVEDGAHIMVLEYVHGFPLSLWLEYRHRCGQLVPVDICLFIVRRILDALHYAHHFDTEEGREIEIVHRDISPDNVLLGNKGYIHLLDFGIASMRGPEGSSTKSSAFRGKLCYAAPETVEGKPATPRSDQYSAAVVLLELLTLETPFQTESIALTFGRMLNDMPDPPSKSRDDVPSGLDAAVTRALDKNPDLRFDSALAFSRELRRFQRDDDEDVTQTLRELIREEFERLPEQLGVEGLRNREAALEKILSIVPPPMQATVRLGQIQPTLLDGKLGDAEDPEPPRRVKSGATAPGQRQLHGLLLGLLVVGGLIALGLGAAVALLSRGGAGEQVVVVGGEADRSDEASAPPPLDTAEPGAAAASSAHASNTAPAVTVLGAASRAAGAPPTDESRTGSPGGKQNRLSSQFGESRQDVLSRAVQQRSGEYEACFARHIESGESEPEATLHFSVAQQGGSAQVGVEPPSVAATPLGGCLRAAASRVQFPELGEPVSFRVPVRARISN